MFALRLADRNLFYSDRELGCWVKDADRATSWPDRETVDKIAEFWTIGELVNKKTGERNGGKAVLGGHSCASVEVVEIEGGVPSRMAALKAA